MNKIINYFLGNKELDAKAWREIYWNKNKAKQALVGLMVPDKQGKLRRVSFVETNDNRRIPVEDVSEETAHEFMKQLCPKWANVKGQE